MEPEDARDWLDKKSFPIGKSESFALFVKRGGWMTKSRP